MFANEVVTAKANEAIPAGLGTGPIATGADANELVTALYPSITANPNCKALLTLNCFLASANSSALPFFNLADFILKNKSLTF